MLCRIGNLYLLANCELAGAPAIQHGRDCAPGPVMKDNKGRAFTADDLRDCRYRDA
jgi:hypothetical protein